MKNLDMPVMSTSLEAADLGFIGISDVAQCIKFNSGLTKREQACITLGIPESGDPELDALILKSERKRIAAMAMQGLLSSESEEYQFRTPYNCALTAIEVSDALLEELAK